VVFAVATLKTEHAAAIALAEGEIVRVSKELSDTETLLKASEKLLKSTQDQLGARKTSGDIEGTKSYPACDYFWLVNHESRWCC